MVYCLRFSSVFYLGGGGGGGGGRWSVWMIIFFIQFRTWLTWRDSLEKLVKHFVIFLNFPCLIACLLCCLRVSFFLYSACFVDRDLCRSGCRQNYYLTSPPPPPPPPLLFFSTHNSLFINTSDSYLKSVRA